MKATADCISEKLSPMVDYGAPKRVRENRKFAKFSRGRPESSIMPAVPGRIEKAIVGLPPDFLLNLMALANFMRLSLMKAAHAGVGGAP
jgi:hypothetical protein